MSILNADKKKWPIEDQGGTQSKSVVVAIRPLFTNLNVACTMQVMLVLHAAICINVSKNTKNRLH